MAIKLTRVKLTTARAGHRVQLSEGDSEFATVDLHTSSTLHDHLQVESSIDLDLKPHDGEKKRFYTIDLFLFIPSSIGINKNTYPKDSFYRDLTNHLRLRTPTFRHWSTGAPAELTLPVSDRYLELHLSSLQRKKLSTAAVAEVKFFGCFVNTALKRLVSRAGHDDLEDDIERLAATLARFRQRYMDAIRNRPLLLDNEVRTAFLLIDEYMSYRLEETLIRVADVSNESIKQNIIHLLEMETTYRQSCSLITVEEGEGHRERLEGYGHRLGLLKKFVSQVLYLQVKLIQREKIYRNLMAAVGAAMAGLWAILADVGKVHGHEKESIWHILMMSIVVILVYVFKDRIKDLSKEYLNDKLKHRLPDLQTVLSYTWFTPQGAESRFTLGSFDECVRYVSASDVPADVAYVRGIGRRRSIEPARHEMIIHYSKELSFDVERVRPLADDVRSVRNVLRFNFAHFLQKLDDPDKDVHYYDPRQGMRVARAPKVYHINVVFRYGVTLYANTPQARRHIDYEKVRVVLDKQGVLRVEEVVPRGELGYEDDVA